MDIFNICNNAVDGAVKWYAKLPNYVVVLIVFLVSVAMLIITGNALDCAWELPACHK